MASRAFWVLAVLLGSLYTAHAWSYVGCFKRDELVITSAGEGKDSSECVDFCYKKHGAPIGVLVRVGWCTADQPGSHTSA